MGPTCIQARNPEIPSLNFVALAYRYSSRTDLSRRLVPLAELAGQAPRTAPKQPHAPPRRLHFRLTDAVRQALVEDYLNGIPTTQLTTKYSLGKGSVLQILEDAGVPMRRQGLNEAEVEPDLAHGFGFWGPLSC